MYTSKNTIQKPRYSPVTSPLVTSYHKTTDFTSFKYNQEHADIDTKFRKSKPSTQSNQGSQKQVPSHYSQTTQSLILSQRQYRFSAFDEHTPNQTSAFTKFPNNRNQSSTLNQNQSFPKKGTTSLESYHFNTFLQMAKKEKERYIPSYSLMYAPKFSLHHQKNETLIVQELRQTEDTVTQKQPFFKSGPLKAADFHQVRLLGKGKNGQVYLAIHKLTGFACAMKIIKKSDINKGTAAEKKIVQNQLLRQIKVQLHMSDPNLIELYAVFSDKDNIYLIQELGIDGQLYDLMKKKFRFSQESTALLSREILKGIKYMHSKHIIHRDIKPQNIVLIYGVAKLCDFGWSVHCPLELRSTLCGTPLYLSPQILIGNEYNQKIDIWAFGTLVYELFTGDNPFQIKNRSDLKKIVTEELDFANNFPRRLRAFLELILKKKSFERPTATQLEGHEFLKKYAELETSEELVS